MRTFLEIQPTLWQSLYLLFRESATANLTSTEIISRISTTLIQYGFTEDLAEITASEFFAMLYDRVASTTSPLYYEESEDAHAYIGYMDIHDLLCKTTDERDERITRLLLSLIVYARTYPHPSGWIRFDRREILHMAGLSRLSSREQDILTSQLHFQYGFDMQVVGSTQPIPCFRINWLSPADETENPLVDIGRFLPQTLRDYHAKYLSPSSAATPSTDGGGSSEGTDSSNSNSNNNNKQSKQGGTKENEFDKLA